MPTRECRFGVRSGDDFGQYWTLRASATRMDFYLASQRTGAFLQVSAHDPAYGLHVRVKTPDGPVLHRYP
jgi:hypothetical protein